MENNEFADPEVRGVRGVFVGVFWKAWCGNGEQNKVTLADSATSAQPQTLLCNFGQAGSKNQRFHYEN